MPRANWEEEEAIKKSNDNWLKRLKRGKRNKTDHPWHATDKIIEKRMKQNLEQIDEECRKIIRRKNIPE
jgi:hypothetical protein